MIKLLLDKQIFASSDAKFYHDMHNDGCNMRNFIHDTYKNHDKAKIAKILCVAAVIVRVAAKFGIWGGKNLLV